MATDESHIRRAIEIPCEEVIDRAGGSTIVEGPVLEREGLAVHEDYFSTPSSHCLRSQFRADFRGPAGTR